LYFKENGNLGLIDGYNQSNVSFGQHLETKARDEGLKPGKTDPHSPGMYRAYVPLQNMDTQAFGIQANDGMYIAPERVKIW
jgi:endothelin-converting enzyme/putative endopeptidase